MMKAEDYSVHALHERLDRPPKGVTTAPPVICCTTALTTSDIFDIHDDDIYFCTADIGWVTGYSYLVYGPLAIGKRR